MMSVQPPADDDADLLGRRLSRVSMVILAMAAVLAARPGSGPTAGSPTATTTVILSPSGAPSVSSAKPTEADTPVLEGAVGLVERSVTVEPVLATDSVAAAAEVVAGWTTPAARASIESGLDAARAGLADTKGGPYRFDAAVLEARAQLTGLGSASVDVWCSEVVFARGRPVYAAYVTEHFELTGTTYGWLVASTSDTDGPSVGLPTSTAVTPPTEAESALVGFSPAGALIEGANP